MIKHYTNYGGKFIALLTAVLMLLTTFMVVEPVKAETAGTNVIQYSEGITGGSISFDTATGTVTDCDTTVTKAVIPETINGVAVTSIGGNAFQDCALLEDVKLPKSLKTLGVQVFYKCTSLISIDIPEGVSEIDNNTFWGCEKLASVNLPESITSIFSAAFYGCKSLKTIKLPDKLAIIGRQAFDGCTSLEQIIIPSGVRSIGNSAFWGCKSLTEVKIPGSVDYIDNATFSSCYGLKSITIESGVKKINVGAFSHCMKLEYIVIPSSVTTIDDNAFDFDYGVSVTIYGDIGSRAESYAKEKNVTFQSIKDGIVIPPSDGDGETDNPSSGDEENGDSGNKEEIDLSQGAYGWTEWSTEEPPSGVESESKTQYRYRDKVIKYSGYETLNGYTKLDTTLCSTTYGNWSTGLPSTSDTQGDNYRTIVSVETQSAYYSFAYCCDCKKWYWKNEHGKHDICDSNTRNLIQVYSSQSLSNSGYMLDPTDDSYAVAKTIGNSSPGKLGTVYLVMYKGNTVDSFTSNTKNTWLWQSNGKKKTIYRPVTQKYQYTHWNWGDWSAWGDVEVKATDDRKVETRTVYRHKVFKKYQKLNCTDTFNKTYGNKSFDLKASASSPLIYDSNNTNVAKVSSNGTVTIKGAGKAVITVIAKEDNSYLPVTKYVNVNVSKATARLTYRGSSQYTKECGDKSFRLNASSATGVTYKSRNKSVAKVSSSGSVSLIGPGTTTISITSKGTANYNSQTKTIEVRVGLKKPTLKVKAYSGKKIKLTWSKVPGADGYKVYIYDSKSKKYVCRLTKKSSVKSVTHRGLRSGKTYKYKVRAYRYVSGKKVYSSYSSVKTAKAKR